MRASKSLLRSGVSTAVMGVCQQPGPGPWLVLLTPQRLLSCKSPSDGLLGEAGNGTAAGELGASSGTRARPAKRDFTELVTGANHQKAGNGVRAWLTPQTTFSNFRLSDMATQRWHRRP